MYAGSKASTAPLALDTTPSMGSQANNNPLSVDGRGGNAGFDMYAGSKASTAPLGPLGSSAMGGNGEESGPNAALGESDWKFALSGADRSAVGSFVGGGIRSYEERDEDLEQDDKVYFEAEPTNTYYENNNMSRDTPAGDGKWGDQPLLTTNVGPLPVVLSAEPYIEPSKRNPERKSFRMASGKKNPGLNPLPAVLSSEPYVDPSRLNIAISCRATITTGSPRIAKKAIGLQPLPSVLSVSEPYMDPGKRAASISCRNVAPTKTKSKSRGMTTRPFTRVTIPQFNAVTRKVGASRAALKEMQAQLRQLSTARDEKLLKRFGAMIQWSPQRPSKDSIRGRDGISGGGANDAFSTDDEQVADGPSKATHVKMRDFKEMQLKLEKIEDMKVQVSKAVASFDQLFLDDLFSSGSEDEDMDLPANSPMLDWMSKVRDGLDKEQAGDAGSVLQTQRCEPNRTSHSSHNVSKKKKSNTKKKKPTKPNNGQQQKANTNNLAAGLRPTLDKDFGSEPELATKMYSWHIENINAATIDQQLRIEQRRLQLLEENIGSDPALVEEWLALLKVRSSLGTPPIDAVRLRKEQLLAAAKTAAQPVSILKTTLSDLLRAQQPQPPPPPPQDQQLSDRPKSPVITDSAIVQETPGYFPDTKVQKKAPETGVSTRRSLADMFMQYGSPTHPAAVATSPSYGGADSGAVNEKKDQSNEPMSPAASPKTQEAAKSLRGVAGELSLTQNDDRESKARPASSLKGRGKMEIIGLQAALDRTGTFEQGALKEPLNKAKSRSFKETLPQRAESMLAKFAQIKSSIMTNLTPLQQVPLSPERPSTKTTGGVLSTEPTDAEYAAPHAQPRDNTVLEPEYEYAAPAPSRATTPMTPIFQNTRTSTASYRSPGGSKATVTITTPASPGELPPSPSRRASKMVSKMFSSAKAKANQAYEAYHTRRTASQPNFNAFKKSEVLNAEETKVEKELIVRQKKQLADQLLLQKALRDIGRGKVEKPNTRTETLTRKGDYKFDGLTVVEIGKKTLKETKIKVGESILEVNGTFAMNTAHVMKLLREASYPTKVKVAQVGQNFSDI